MNYLSPGVVSITNFFYNILIQNRRKQCHFKSKRKKLLRQILEVRKKQDEVKNRIIKTTVKGKHNCIINILIIKSYKIGKSPSAGTREGRRC